MKLFEFFLKKSTLIHLITFMMLFVGLLSMFFLKRAIYPSVDLSVIKVTTTLPGASAEDIETLVTNKIEDELDSVSGIDRTFSASMENLSIIYVVIDADEKNLEDIKDEVFRAIEQTSDLPTEIDGKPVIEEINSNNVSVIEIAVTGDVKERELRKVAKSLQEDISEIDGVGKIQKVGYRKREVRIRLDAKKLDKHYLSLAEVSESIQNYNLKLSGGNTYSYSNQKKVITDSEFKHPKDVKNVIVRSNFSGQQIRLQEIAEVRNSYEDHQVISRTNQKPSITLLISSQEDSDAITISDEIKKLIARYNQNLPENIKIGITIDFSRYTKSLLGIVKSNAVIGFLLVLLCLFVFLSSYTAIWTASGILLSVVSATIFFPIFGIDINFISLIAMVLVLGLLVDDAIVIAENITRHREMGKNALESAKDGVKEVFWPVTTTIVTTIIAFIPMFFMSGVTGKFVRELPIVVILCLIISLVEATIILPGHITTSPAQKPRENLWFEKLKILYKNTLEKILQKKYLTTFVFLLFLLGTILPFQFGLKFILFPYDDVDVFYVIAELPQGTSIQKTEKSLIPVEQMIIDTVPESEREGIATRVGHHDTDVYGLTKGLHKNWGMITVYLRPSRERDRNSQLIMDDVKAELKTFKDFSKLYVEKYYDGPPIGRPIEIRLAGDDNKVRQKYTKKITDYLKTIQGIINLEIDEQELDQEIKVIPDYETMARLQLNSLQVSQFIRMAYDGIIVTNITRDGEEIDYRVQYSKKDQKEISDLKNIKILNPQGKLIPLHAFAKIIKSEGRSIIHHYNSKRSTTISSDVDEKFTSSAEANELVRKKFEKEISEVPGLTMVQGGEEKETQKSMQSFYWAFLCAIIGIYCVLVILFDSFFQPFIIIAAIPFGLAGVVYVFFIWGLPLSFLGMIGCLGLVGIVVNDALIMVSHLNEVRNKTGKLSLEGIIQGSMERLRPVLLTTITTVAGMVPTILGIGGYEPFIVPVVLSVAGGLLLATFITLVLVPTFYSFGLKNSD